MSDTSVYEKLSEKIFMAGSAIIPELWSMIADENEATALLTLPGTAAEVAAQTGLESSAVETMLEGLYHKGVVFKSVKPEGTKYRLASSLVQFHDASILWPEAPQAYLDLWQRYMEEEWPSYAKVVMGVLPRPFTRIIPVEQPIEVKNRILAFEDVDSLIEAANQVAVTNCTCRLIAHKCDKPVEVCLQIGKAAAYTIDRGSGRSVTKEEARKILRLSEEAGLVHVTMNRAGDSHFICNCCDDCCMSFTLLISDAVNLCDPSRFAAQVDSEACTGCALCEERCYFGALSMGNEGTVQILAEKCMGCGLCQVACPEKAIAMVQVREEEFIPQA